MGNTPHFLKCPKCNSASGRFTRAADDAHQHLEATGNRVSNPSTRRSRRTSAWKTEVRHHCGHVFWTTHADADALYAAGKAANPSPSQIA